MWPFSPLLLNPNPNSCYCVKLAWPHSLFSLHLCYQAVRLWDPRTAEKLHMLKGHTDTVRSIAIAPEGLRCITASSGTTCYACVCMLNLKFNVDNHFPIHPSTHGFRWHLKNLGSDTAAVYHHHRRTHRQCVGTCSISLIHPHLFWQ